VTCSLALHHFSDEEAIKVLGEMRACAGMAFIINDLRRSLLDTWRLERTDCCLHAARLREVTAALGTSRFHNGGAGPAG
jgi:hypothetical protein